MARFSFVKEGDVFFSAVNLVTLQRENQQDLLSAIVQIEMALRVST
jgi:hypothetical protein